MLSFPIKRNKPNFWSIWFVLAFCPKCSQNMFYVSFTLYTVVTSCKKSKKLNASICYLKKTNFRSLFVQIPMQDFSKKSIWVNFQPLCCCQFMLKIRKVPCIDFSQNLKNLVLGPFCTPFGPKTSKQIFFPKNILFNFKSLGCCNFMQKIR